MAIRLPMLRKRTPTTYRSEVARGGIRRGASEAEPWTDGADGADWAGCFECFPNDPVL